MLTSTRAYCFINGKIKKEPRNLELDINVAINGQFRIFSTANGKFRSAQREIRMPRNTAGPVYHMNRV